MADCSSSTTPRSRTYWALLLLVAALALALRVWLWTDQGRAGAIHPGGDQDEYYRGAIHILLRGGYYDDGQWLRPPLTSIFLAAVFAVIGVNVPAALLVQCALSAGTVPLLAELARRLFASRRAGLAAAAAAAVFLPYIDYASQLLSETLFIFTITAALLLFEVARRRDMSPRWTLAGGILWGLAALTRPVGLYAVPLLLVWVCWERARGARPDDKAAGGRPRVYPQAAVDRAGEAAMPTEAEAGGARPARGHAALQSALATLLGFVLVVAPWTARNYAVYHQLVLVDTNGGVSLWMGNLLEPGERELQFVWNRTLPDSAQRQRMALDRARANIAREPRLFLTRMRYKIVALWQLDTRLFAGNAIIGIALDKRSVPFALASDAQYVALMLLALLGVIVARPAERNLALLGWPLYGTLLTAVSLGHPRLRLPLLVTVFVYAALPLAHPRLTWARLRMAPWWRRALLLAGVVVITFLIYARVYVPFGQSQLWLAAARLGGGAAAIERAIAAASGNYLPYTRLGDLRRAGGDEAGALAAYDLAAARAPDNTYTQLRRLELLRRTGDRAGAPRALDAIAASGAETNQLYDWAWRNMPANAGARLDVAAPAPGIVRGVYPLERDGERPFRWTMGRAQFRFDLPGADRLGLVLRADRPTTPVEVFYEGERVGLLRVGTDWQTFQIPLEPAPRGDAVRPGDRGVLELRVDTHVASPAEPYPRGVALAEAWLERSPPPDSRGSTRVCGVVSSAVAPRLPGLCYTSAVRARIDRKIARSQTAPVERAGGD